MRSLNLLSPALLVVLAIRNTSAAPTDGDSPIAGGRPARLDQFPHQALIVSDDAMQCGGSLITRSKVLTAAHCIHKFKTFTVYLGGINITMLETFWRTITPWAIVNPGSKSFPNLTNDVGVVFLMEEAPRNRYINPVNLPSMFEVNNSYVGDTLRISGWGMLMHGDSNLTSDILQWTEVTVIPNSECQNLCILITPSRITESNLCTRGKHSDSWHGDSGGALVRQVGSEYVQIGVTSFACQPFYPTVYTRVTSFLDWIARMAED